MINIQKPQRPLMLAYLLFLTACTLLYPLKEYLPSDFLEWNKIIVGTTIASYFFSLSSINNVNSALEEQSLSLYEEQRTLYNKITAIEKQFSERKTKNDELGKAFAQEIETNEKNIKTAQKRIKSNKAFFFCYNVCGYISFFFILSSSTIFLFFERNQEWFTLLAFLIVTFVEYFKATTMKYYTNLSNKAKENIRNTMMRLEEKKNG